jgi:hypothetical protein
MFEPSTRARVRVLKSVFLAVDKKPVSSMKKPFTIVYGCIRRGLSDGFSSGESEAAKECSEMAQKGAQQQNRSNAREQATSGASGGSTGRTMPAPVEENAGGTDAAAQEAAPAPSACMVIFPNPKRKGSQSYGFYEKYGPRHTLTDVDAVKKAGVRGKDLTWDAMRRHILIGDHATNFPVNGTAEEQANYLRGIDKDVFTDATLIKLGYLPEPAPAAAEGEKQNA